MKQEYIETFLSVAKTRNILRTSEELYISQGAVSMRIKQLEEELEVPLLMRGRGLKHIDLTPQGYAFLDIARAWETLEENARQLKNRDYFLTLHIMANDMLNTQIFTDVYKAFATAHHDYMLQITTSTASGVYEAVAARSCHVGLSTSLHSYEGVRITPLITETFFFVSFKDHPFLKNRNQCDLDFEKEIYMSWNSAYETWHQAYSEAARRHYVVVSTASMLPHFLEEHDQWMIVPESTARLMMKDARLGCCEMPEIPTRTIYLVEPKNISSTYMQAIALFKEALMQHIAISE